MGINTDELKNTLRKTCKETGADDVNVIYRDTTNKETLEITFYNYILPEDKPGE